MKQKTKWVLISMITFIKINRSQIKKTKITIYKLAKKKNKTKLSHFIQTLWYIHFHNSIAIFYVDRKKENQSQKQKKNKRKNRGK